MTTITLNWRLPSVFECSVVDMEKKKKCNISHYCARHFKRRITCVSVGVPTYVANPVAKAREFPFGRGHDAIGDDFARGVLDVDGRVRSEVLRKSFEKRDVLLLGRQRSHPSDSGDQQDQRLHDLITTIIETVFIYIFF